MVRCDVCKASSAAEEGIGPGVNHFSTASAYRESQMFPSSRCGCVLLVVTLFVLSVYSLFILLSPLCVTTERSSSSCFFLFRPVQSAVPRSNLAWVLTRFKQIICLLADVNTINTTSAPERFSTTLPTTGFTPEACLGFTAWLI